MTSPLSSYPTTTFTGSSGNTLIDAMLITVETLRVPVAQRATVVGHTGAKWGGSVGTGVDLTYSFITKSSVFASDAGDAPNGIVEMSENLRQIFRSALTEWADVANVTFREVTEASTTAGDIRIGVSTTGVDQNGAQAGAPGYPGTASGDVWVGAVLAQQEVQFPTPPAGYPLHELGHAIFGLNDVTTNLGLNGAALPPSLNDKIHTDMSYSALHGVSPGASYSDTQGGYSISPSTPMVLDILAAQYVYGSNLNYHAGDDVYRFLPGQNYFETIWDAGGENTFDASAITHNCVLDLRQGQYSDVGTSMVYSTGGASVLGTLTATVAIAFGVIIQNAIGGSGNDTIIGNDSQNNLTGGLGNDSLDGGSGIDTAMFSGRRSAYTLTLSGDRLIVSGPDGTDTLTRIEKLAFDDGTIPSGLELVSSVYRFFDSATGDHFYTFSTTEANNIRATLPTYHDEGSPWGTPEAGVNTTDVFRFFDVATSTHFLTSSTAERDHVIATLPSYHYEGVGFQAYTAPGGGTLTLERFFNKQSHLHHYAASPAEIASILSGGAGPGWVDEGAGFIVHT
jgi:Ca2+-binding RTX toxin-like protein